MGYRLAFLKEALKEWERLDSTVQEQFKNKLAERLDEPCVLASKLSGYKDRYKIKLRTSGYRLIYEIENGELVVTVIAVGKRDRNAVYSIAAKR
jgi:mRNA interferase RelE/StbE